MEHEEREEQRGPSGRAAGGHARAARLSPAERREIARRAAQSRWKSGLSTAVCGSPDQPLRIGDMEIECYVLDDGTRVLTQASFLRALGRHPKANVRREGGERLPAILQGKAINEFISPEILEQGYPITFQTPRGARASGYNALLLPAVCEIYLKARDAGVLPANQEHVAKQADILVRGLARVGIVALVDEATGYQEFREREALSRILQAFIAKELQPWVRTFPPDFYRELFRLRGLDYPSSTVKRPQYFGHITNDIVYRRIAPGVLDELKRVQVKGDEGRPKHKLFQRLTQNPGYPKLREHLGSVVTLMKLSRDYPDFHAKLDQIHPRFGETIMLPFDEEADDSGIGL
jgi:P63C domain